MAASCDPHRNADGGIVSAVLRFFHSKLRLFRNLLVALAACTCALVPSHVSAADPPTTQPTPHTAPMKSVPPVAATAAPEPDAEIAALPMSNAARVRLDRARDSIVQVRGFFGDSQSDAFHGSGFAVTS